MGKTVFEEENSGWFIEEIKTKEFYNYLARSFVKEERFATVFNEKDCADHLDIFNGKETNRCRAIPVCVKRHLEIIKYL